MEAVRKYKRQIYFHLALNFCCAIFVAYASFVHYPLHHFRDRFFYLGQFLALQFTLFGFLYFLSISKILFRIFFPIVFIIFSMIAYWVYAQDIAISTGVIQASLETKPDIIFDLISVPFIAYIIASILAVAFLIKMHGKIAVNQLKSPLIIFAIVGMLTYFTVEDFKYGVFTRRLPYNAITAIREYFSRDPIVLKSVNTTLTTSTDSLNVIFILGESVRADHLGLNGYGRNTTPGLSKRKNIISFPSTYTPKTYTGESLPQILTDASLSDDYSQTKYSLLDVLNHAGIQTNWIGNQTPEKSFEAFVKQAAKSDIIDQAHSELSFRKDHDEKLLPLLHQEASSKNNFTILHMMGSHWYYETRYPEAFRIYKPVVNSKYIPSNSADQMINSYDNTILYLDYFLDQVISRSEKSKSSTLIIYLSDHGELLGEKGLWLHAQKGKPVANPAMLVWYSDGFKKRYPELVRKLESDKKGKIDLDFFFPSMLDLFGIEGIGYDKNKSLFK